MSVSYLELPGQDGCHRSSRMFLFGPGLKMGYDTHVIYKHSCPFSEKQINWLSQASLLDYFDFWVIKLVWHNFLSAMLQ